ncbi:MAG: hypothetical protein ACI9XC_001646 [Gammaproteobacteria bacterium]|jgi:hypothetical protein
METVNGSCHCQAVRFEIDLDNGLENLRRCNCSLCQRKNAVMTCVPMEQFRVIQGEEVLTSYKWNTKVAEHYFCSICGIYTHHRRRLDPTSYGFNVACLEGVDPNTLADISVFNGESLSLE